MAKIDSLEFGVVVRKCKECDRVEVVRCEDCEHYDCRICKLHSEEPDQYSTGHTAYMEPDDFCSYGERRCNDGE